MNFKNWLEKLEEAKGNYSPQGNIFQGVQHGYGAMYGADRAGPPPIGWGFNNLAAASFIDGIGKARSKERARMGSEPGSVSQYEDPFWNMENKSMQTIYMPLQLPLNHQEGDLKYYSKSLITFARTISSMPIEDSQIYNVDKQMKLKNYPDKMKTKLSFYEKEYPTNPNDIETSVNFTKALMLASLVVKLQKYAHLLDLEKPNLKNVKYMEFPFDDDAYYKVMMCAFIFSKKDKDEHLGDDVHDEIRQLDQIRQKQNKPQTPRNSGGPSKPSTSVS